MIKKLFILLFLSIGLVANTQILSNSQGKLITNPSGHLITLPNNLQFYSGQGSSISNFSVILRVDAGKTCYINWGNGIITTVTGNGSNTTYTSNYTIVNSTYPIQITGDLSYIRRFEINPPTNANITFLNSLGFRKLTGLQEISLASQVHCTNFYLNNLSTSISYAWLDSYKFTVVGDIGQFINLTYFRTGVYNTGLYGSIAGLTGLNYLNVLGNNTLSGSIAGLTGLTFIQVGGSNTLSGSISGLTGLTYLNVVGNNTLSGSIAGLTGLNYLNVLGNNTLSGSIAGLTGLTFIQVGGSNTLSGSISGLTGLTVLAVGGSNTLSIPDNLTNITGLGYFIACSNWVLDATHVNQYLADFWANRDAAKPRNERVINLTAGTGTSAPTGQGLTDKSNLQNYRSPNNLAQYSLWTVTTR